MNRMRALATSVRTAWRGRWPRRIALLVLLPLPLWILALNLALWTGAVAALVTHEGVTTQVQLRYGWAWTLWPTRAHVHDASLQIDAYSYQLGLEVDEAYVDIRLLDLLDRRVRFAEIQATGVRAEYRAKVDPEEADDPELDAFSPFDGARVPVQSTIPKPMPAHGEAWTVDLDDVDADVDMLWIDEFDMQPCGHIRGAMHWTDGGPFEVPTTTVQLAEATLWLGDAVAIEALDGDGELTLAEFDSGNTDGAKIPAYLSFAFDGSGVLAQPQALAVWWPQLRRHVDHGRGPLELDVSATEGVLDPGSRIHYRSQRIALGPSHARTHGGLDVTLAVDSEATPRADVTVTNAELVMNDVAIAHGDEIRGDMQLTHGDMARPWRLAGAHVDAQHLAVDELARVSRALDARGWAFTRGSAVAELHAEVDGELGVTAQFDERLRRAVFEAGPVRVAADVRTRGRVHVRRGEPIVVDDIAVHTGDLTVHSSGGDSDGTWVRLDRSRLSYDDRHLVVDLRGKLEDARPAIVHFTHLDTLVEAVPDLHRLEQVSLHARLDVRPDRVTVELIRAEQLGLVAHASWHKQGEHWRAAVLLTGLAMIGLELDDRGLHRLAVLVGKPWFDARKAWVAGADATAASASHRRATAR